MDPGQASASPAIGASDEADEFAAVGLAHPSVCRRAAASKNPRTSGHPHHLIHVVADE